MVIGTFGLPVGLRSQSQPRTSFWLFFTEGSVGPARSLSETSDVSAECSSGSMELAVAPLCEDLVKSQQGPRTHFTRDMKTWPTPDSHIH